VYTVHPNVLQEGYEAAFIHLTAPTNHTTKAQKRKDPGLFELIKKVRSKFGFKQLCTEHNNVDFVRSS